jgi:hypothetical protein
VISLPICILLNIVDSNVYTNFFNFIKDFYIIFVLYAIIFAPIVGYILAKYYYGENGVLSKFYKKYTRKINTTSIFSELWRQYKKGVWITFHMKDSTILQGKAKYLSKDEEKKEYVFVINDVKRYFIKDNKIKELKLTGKDILVNSKDTNIIEFHD